MNNGTQNETPRWYAIRTHSKQEHRAEDNLRAWKVETFAPKFQARRYSNGALVRTVKPLFPGYIFARFSVNELLHKVRFTRGVSSIVCFGGNPTPVDDQIIDIIKTQIGEGGFVRLGEKLKVGDAVVIKDGPLKNFTGIFERELVHTDRVMLLLTTISYQSHVVIERELVRKVSAAGRGA
jgi:transcriptional antiterminator RfaH